jgi:AcrR family transcriptional regulator
MIKDVEPAAKTSVEDTRVRIMAAARELYATKGSRGTTTREVADRAGVNEATLFRHFGTKVQLISAMLDHYAGVTNFPEVVERARLLPTIEAQLQSLGMAAVEAIRRKHDLIKISMAEELTNPEGHSCAWRAPTEARHRLTQFFAEKVASGDLRGEPDWLARVFMSLFFSLVLARGIWEDEAQAPERAVSTMVGIFLHGAGAR